MTMDEALDAFTDSEGVPAGAMQWVLDAWETTGPLCRVLLHAYVTGEDLSERTEQALYVIIPLMGEKADTASFPLLCRLAMDESRANSVLGDFGMTNMLPSILVSTFDGDSTALHRLVETPDVDELLRGDVLLVLAYLARTHRIPETDMYAYLAGLPDRLDADAGAFVWFGWVRAVTALGFAGLSGRAEQLFQRGLVDTTIINQSGFWAELRESQADPTGTSGKAWDGIAPMDSAIGCLSSQLDVASTPEDPGSDWFEPSEPVRNPLRHVGRNDPCPCGGGKKYKKCCLAA